MVKKNMKKNLLFLFLFLFFSFNLFALNLSYDFSPSDTWDPLYSRYLSPDSSSVSQGSYRYKLAAVLSSSSSSVWRSQIMSSYNGGAWSPTAYYMPNLPWGYTTYTQGIFNVSSSCPFSCWQAKFQNYKRLTVRCTVTNSSSISGSVQIMCSTTPASGFCAITLPQGSTTTGSWTYDYPLESSTSYIFTATAPQQLWTSSFNLSDYQSGDTVNFNFVYTASGQGSEINPTPSDGSTNDGDTPTPQSYDFEESASPIPTPDSVPDSSPSPSGSQSSDNYKDFLDALNDSGMSVSTPSYTAPDFGTDGVGSDGSVDGKSFIESCNALKSALIVFRDKFFKIFEFRAVPTAVWDICTIYGYHAVVDLSDYPAIPDYLYPLFIFLISVGVFYCCVETIMYLFF